MGPFVLSPFSNSVFQTRPAGIATYTVPTAWITSVALVRTSAEIDCLSMGYHNWPRRLRPQGLQWRFEPLSRAIDAPPSPFKVK